MGLGVVDDGDFENEVANSNVHIIELPNKGRNEGDKNVPDFLRSIISNTAIEESSKEANKLASRFGVSASSVSAYKHGNTSTDSYHLPNAELTKNNNTTRDKIIKRGKAKILAAMRHITDDKMENANAKDLSSIAKDMSVVVKNMDPSDKLNESTGPQVQFVFYAPQVRSLDSYDQLPIIDS